MNRQATVMAMSFLVFSCAVQAVDDVKWSYTGPGGPAHWGGLDPAFATCLQGRNQSPIDVSGFIDADLAPIDFSYRSYATEILHNGHTVQLNFAPASAITIEGRRFELKQLHFHAPSENRIDGESFAAEVHLVHADGGGELAVVSVMLAAGERFDALRELWTKLPEATNTIELLPKFGAAMFLPDTRDYYRFNGSLTTPPCSEGVLWLVMKTPLAVSKQQISALQRVLGHANNREVQAVYARPILE